MLDFRDAILTLAQQTPDAAAVVDDRGGLTRGALALRAGGVAIWAAGLPAGTTKARIIAILAPAGGAQIAAMLGVSASGAAFMPIDPTLPAARIRAMLERAGPVGLLHDQAFSELAAQLATDMPRASLDELACAPLGLSPVRPDAAAYVMFTSGSTGAPKGILGRYKSLNHFLTWQRDSFDLDATTRSAQLAPVTFDVSLRDVLLPLSLGGVVTVPPRDLIAVPRKLLGWLRDHDVTLLHCVPSLLRLLTSELALSPDAERATPDALRHLFLAGEPLLGRDVKAWRAVTGADTTIVNLYGPSETTLAKVFARVGPDADLPDGMLPIGQSLPDTDVLILKADRIAVPGEIGEICIRTGFPSLGYLNDLEATRTVFQRNPFGTEANDILYRSGDMGRRRPDGQIECLGRRDSQVKIAGNRVEGAEVESVLRGLSGVSGCTVVINRDDPADPFLVAYVTGDAPDQDELRGALRDILPDYMLPRFIVPLDALPMLMNGKIDKRALPRPEALVHGDAGPVPAATATERRVEGIWQQILGLETVGVETPFANLGGDSLKAIKVLGAIYRETGIELRIADFFAARTIRALSLILDDPETTGGGGAMTSIPQAAAAAHDPLSDTQEPLWAMQQIGMNPTVYNLCFGFRAEGGLDLARLERAFVHLIQSYEILRTRISVVDGQPRQVIVDDAGFRIEHQELPADEDFEGAAQALLRAERQRPFDLGVAPLVRVVAVQALGDGPVFLVISFHHAVCDGQSLNTVVDLIGQAYANDAPLAAPSLQYRDVTAWQTARLATPGAERLRSYWKTCLDGAPRAIDLPEAQPRPAQQQFHGATLRHDLPRHLAKDLTALARNGDSSLFNALLTGLAIALDQRADQPDMVIATPVLGRNHPDLADQIGFFANTLCLRVTLDRAGSVSDGLQQVTRRAHEALDHQDWPFNRLVADLNEPRDLSRNPVCNVMLVLFDADRPELSLPGVSLTAFGRDTEWAFSRFDLVFHVTHDSRTGAMVLDLNHDTALFDTAQVARIARHFQTILEQMAAAPDRAIGTLTPHDSAQTAIVASLDRTALAADEATLTALFAKVVATTPEAIAVVDDHAALSYGALDQWSNGIAQTLVAQGVGPERTVAISGARSAAGVAAILGVLKAGGAWVALDERWPRARTDAVLRDADASVVLEGDAARVTPNALRVQDIDSSAKPMDHATPTGLAYVVFTSGSTGTPKGVMIEHRAVTNMLRQQINAFGVTPDSRFLQFAAPVFDAHVSEVFVTLLAGGRLVIPSRDTLENPAALKRAMGDHGVTHATLPPSFLDVARDVLPETLEVLITAGESARPEESRRLGARFRLINAYGPAENAVCSTVYVVDPQDIESVVPIGAPINGTGLTLLDGSGRAVPVGVPGQLMLHGAGLARGYLGQPELTAAVFSSADVPGGRRYATGDIAMLRDDGAVVFLGRQDDQIKISGQRLELAEVEARLNAAPDVARAIAAPVTGAGGRTTLGAWVLRAPGPVSLWPSVAEFFVYDDVVYQAMAGDRGRNARYAEGFQRHLPGQTVLEVGPGPYAILSRMAIEAGARHVYAIEINPEIADRARAAVIEAGMQDRITVLTGDATELVLPEPADWCISEIVGGIGGSEGAAAILNGVRANLSHPENMLPRSSVTRIAAVDLPMSQIDPGFSSVAADYVRRIFEQRGRPFDLRLCLRRFDRDRLLSSSDVFENLNFTHEMTLEGAHDISLDVLRDGHMSGFVLWLTMDVGANRGIDVLSDTSSWLPVYVPLGSGGIAVHQGDQIRARITRTLDAGGRHPDFDIKGALMRGADEVMPLRVAVPHMAPDFGNSPLHSHLFNASGQPRIVEDGFLDGIRAYAAAHLPRYAVPGILREIETLPRTVNGKLARAELPDLVAQGQNSSLVPVDISDLASQIAGVFARMLERESIDPTIGFFELGGDSISAVRAVGALATEQIDVTAAEILHHQSAVALSSVARQAGRREISRNIGPVPAHPVQAWFMARHPHVTRRFNQSVLISLPERADIAVLEDALQVLLRRHGALRLTFAPGTGGIEEPEYSQQQPLLQVDELRDLSPDALAARRDAAAERAHDMIDPLLGQLVSARLLRDAERDQLLLVAHHLSVDMLSWQTLIAELDQLLHDPQKPLPEVRAHYTNICAALAKEALSPTTTTEKPFWDSVARLADSLVLPEPTNGAVRDMMPLRLDIPDSVTAFDAHKGADMQSRLLRAMADAAKIVLGWSQSVIDLETHGRDLPRQVPDASGIVGWFTRITPVVVAAQSKGDVLSEVPRGGLGFGLLAWQRGNHDALRDVQAPMALNYLGDLSVAKPIPERAAGLQIDWDGLGQGIDPAFRTGHALSVLAHQSDSGLFLSLSVDLALVRLDVAQAFGAALRAELMTATPVPAHSAVGEIDMEALAADLGL
ncbi:non-ribosomal peptide synthetase [Puniceibacterium sp. IMCC21224]|uniref:non-ribosomal peptide synthetase n=1 Tax=Puniceibacterium sp. IMCC21224 TaxID=1618204 RepID=UPI00064DBB25|nr:non-ribosomal peptide synthetase [Puniceibacterium sp. IMCC21224]KMK66291.1 amino acid adenylation enzyme/thioester reductase family protein [Puniceibacterium sp. IMCC21224]